MLSVVFVLPETLTLILETSSFEWLLQINVHIIVFICACYCVLKCICCLETTSESTNLKPLISSIEIIDWLSYKIFSSNLMTQHFYFHTYACEKNGLPNV